MLDTDLAVLYGVKAIRLREQVSRNSERFPADFMFQVTEEEARVMVSQNAIPSWKYLGGHLPLVFTQEGVAMLSGVLRSRRAVEANIAIMRAFVRQREVILSNAKLAAKLAELERKYDAKFKSVFKAIKALMVEPDPGEEPKTVQGFKP